MPNAAAIERHADRLLAEGHFEGFAESRGPEREAGRRAAADMVEEYALFNDGRLPTARELYSFEIENDPPTPPAAATRTTPTAPRPQPPSVREQFRAETDPRKRAELYSKHKADIFSN